MTWHPEAIVAASDFAPELSWLEHSDVLWNQKLAYLAAQTGAALCLCVCNKGHLLIWQTAS